MKKSATYSKTIVRAIPLITIMASFPIAPKLGGVAIFYYLVVLLEVVYFLFTPKLSIPSEIRSLWFYFAYLLLAFFAKGGYVRAFQLFFLEIIPVCILYASIRNTDGLHKAMDCIIVVSAIVSIIGMAESITGTNLFDMIFHVQFDMTGANSYRFGMPRSHGYNSTSINHGLALMLAESLVVYRLSLNTKKMRFGLMVAYVLIAGNIFTTFSRGAIIPFAVLQVYYAYKCKIIRNPRRLLLVLGGIVGVGLILTIAGAGYGFVIQAIKQMIAPIISSEYSTDGLGGVGGRYELFQWIWDAVSKHWLLGMGYNTQFQYQVNDWIVKTSIENEFLVRLFRLGLLGLGMFVFFIICLVRYLWKQSKKEMQPYETNLQFNTVILVSIVLYYVSLLGVAQSEDYRMEMLLLGLTISYNQIAKKTRDV